MSPIYPGEKGAFLLHLTRVLHQPVPFSLLWGRPCAQDMMGFCHQFAALLNAGIPVLTGLLILEKQTDNPRLKHGVKRVAFHVENGHSLAEAMAQVQEVFSPFCVGMVDAGEMGGMLDKTMHRLALHYEKKNHLEKKIKTATAYPKFIFLVILGVVVFLLSFVMPSFAGTFNSMGVELPLFTQFLMSLGGWIRVSWPYLLFAGAIVYLVLCSLLKMDKVAYYAGHMQLRLPLFGLLYRKLLVARFCRTFSTLLGSGVTLLTALELSKNVVVNRVFVERVAEMRNAIVRGESVASALSAAKIFPLMVIGMVDVGEQSGKLDEMLRRAADLYESEVNYVVDRLGSLLEPALVIFLAVVVGGIVLSVFLPLFGVFELYL